MFKKTKELVDEKLVQPIRKIYLIAAGAFVLAVMALLVAIR